MVAAIKQKVTVNADGNIVIRAADLPPGTPAEVHVFVEQATPAPLSEPDSFIAALDALQKSMNLTPEDADRWAAENRALREWNRPRE